MFTQGDSGVGMIAPNVFRGILRFAGWLVVGLLLEGSGTAQEAPLLSNGNFQDGLASWEVRPTPHGPLHGGQPFLLEENRASLLRYQELAPIVRWQRDTSIPFNQDIDVLSEAAGKFFNIRSKAGITTQSTLSMVQVLKVSDVRNVGLNAKFRVGERHGLPKAILEVEFFRGDYPVGRMLYYLGGVPGGGWFQTPNTIFEDASKRRFFSAAVVFPENPGQWYDTKNRNPAEDFNAAVRRHGSTESKLLEELHPDRLVVTLRHDIHQPGDVLSMDYRDVRIWSDRSSNNFRKRFDLQKEKPRILSLGQAGITSPELAAFFSRSGIGLALAVSTERGVDLIHAPVPVNPGGRYLLEFWAYNRDETSNLPIIRIKDGEGRELIVHVPGQLRNGNWEKVAVPFRTTESPKIRITIQTPEGTFLYTDFQLTPLPDSLMEIDRTLKEKLHASSIRLDLAPAFQSKMDDIVAEIPPPLPFSPINLKILADQFKEFFPGGMLLDGVQYPMEIRYRGMLADHWTGRKRSYKVRLSNGEKLPKGQKELNFIIPEDDDGLFYEFAFNTLIRRFGLHAPDTHFVGLSMNERFMGLYLQTEEYKSTFWETNSLAPGNVYHAVHLDSQAFGQSGLSSAHNPGWFAKKNAFSLKDHDIRKKDFSELDMLIQVMGMNDDGAFARNIFNILDRDNFASWLAFSLMTGDWHLWGANLRLYFDPGRGKFLIMPWDTVHGLIRGHFDRRVNRPDWIWYPYFVARLLTQTDVAGDVATKIKEYVEGSEVQNDFVRLLETMDRARRIQYMDSLSDIGMFEEMYSRIKNTHLDNLRFWQSNVFEKLSLLARCDETDKEKCRTRHLGLLTPVNKEIVMEELASRGRVFVLVEEQLPEKDYWTFKFLNAGNGQAMVKSIDLTYRPRNRNVQGLEVFIDSNGNGRLDPGDRAIKAKIKNDPGGSINIGLNQLLPKPSGKIWQENRMGFLSFPQEEILLFLRVHRGPAKVGKRVRIKEIEFSIRNRMNEKEIQSHVRFINSHVFREFFDISLSPREFVTRYPMFHPVESGSGARVLRSVR